MKHLFCLFVFCIFSFSSIAQTNLVPNPSFEELEACPRWLGDIHFKDWWAFKDSPDCYNKSCGVSNCEIPKNFAGFQYPINPIENGYAGLIFYRPGGYREVIGCELKSPLASGGKYFISLLINKADSTPFINQCNINNIGVLFTNVHYEDDSIVSLQTPITNHAHFFTNAVISDTINWTKVVGSFISDSNYRYLMIGNFFDSIHTSVTANYSKVNCEAYYYIDDICVSTDSAFTYGYIYTGVNEVNKHNDVIIIQPNPTTHSISCTLPDETTSIEIENIIGQKMAIEKLEPNFKNYTKDVSLFPNGLYFLTIKTNSFLQTIKFIKQ